MTGIHHPLLQQPLQGPSVRLDPTTPEDLPDLWQKLEWDYLRFSLGSIPCSEAEYTELTLKSQQLGQRVAFTIRSADGELLGTSSYLDIRAEHRGLEIGHTWLHRSVWGTTVNPEVKLLMLRHAFDVWQAIRVQLKTDARNLHSQAAIAKLGATREGTLRQHMRMNDGLYRDTVMFSILDHEWPSVRARLLERLVTREDPQP